MSQLHGNEEKEINRLVEYDRDCALAREAARRMGGEAAAEEVRRIQLSREAERRARRDAEPPKAESTDATVKRMLAAHKGAPDPVAVAEIARAVLAGRRSFDGLSDAERGAVTAAMEGLDWDLSQSRFKELLG